MSNSRMRSKSPSPIRQELQKDFSAKAKDILAKLAKRGIKANSQQVYSARYLMKRRNDPDQTFLSFEESAKEEVILFEKNDSLGGLREACIEYAKLKGIASPNDFPDRLIEHHKKMKDALNAYNYSVVEFKKGIK